MAKLRRCHIQQPDPLFGAPRHSTSNPCRCVTEDYDQQESSRDSEAQPDPLFGAPRHSASNPCRCVTEDYDQQESSRDSEAVCLLFRFDAMDLDLDDLEEPVALNKSWAEWLDVLTSLVKDCLLPLFLLHCKRGQARLPVASITASLDAAGGKPLPGTAALAAAQLLAEATPEWLQLEDQPAAVVLLRPDGNHSKTHRPAMCAGVVAKGYSLALPDESTTIGSRDAQSKRWKAAQQSFYADARSLERDLSSIQACILGRLQEIAEERSKQGEEPTPVHGASADTSVRMQQHKEAAAAEGLDQSVLGFISAVEQHPDYRQQVCHVKHYLPRPAKFASFETLVDHGGMPLLSPEARRALRQMTIEELFEHQHTALRAA
eukprot:symbB.v1.2.012813.t1/scaffold884.1/size313170/25